MVAARFLDTFTPSPAVYQARGTAAPADFRVGTLTADMSGTTGYRDVRQNQEQVKAFTYWNYVAISAIAEKAMQQTPQVGVKRAKASGRQRLTQAQRDYLRQSYGNLSHNEDFEPLADTHPLVVLLRDVNPFDSWCEFAYETLLFWELTGEFFWWLIPNGIGLPVEMYVVPTQWVHEKRGPDGQLEIYRIIPDGDFTRTAEVDPENMLHGMTKNPRSKTRGLSSLQAAPMWSDNVLNIEQSRWYGFRNGVNPDLVVTLDGDQYKKPEQSVLDRIKEKFFQRSAGVKRTGEPLILPPGVKAAPWSRTNEEMAYVESADQTRDNNLALHRTSKTIAGLTDDVNRASFEGSMVAWCEMKINPRLRLLASIMQEKLAALFDPRILVWFNDCTPRNAEQELRETQLDGQLGAITPDERRQERGREPRGTSHYMTGWIPTSLQPLDEELQPDPEADPNKPVPPDGAEDDEADDAEE